MSVIQQEVTVEDAREDDDDPDYTFALELQAQEAEEYDRMRRQEASSMERIRVVQQEDPKREEVRQTLQRYYDREAHRELDRDEPVEVHTVHHHGTGVPVTHSVAPVAAAAVAAAKPTFAEEVVQRAELGHEALGQEEPPPVQELVVVVEWWRTDPPHLNDVGEDDATASIAAERRQQVLSRINQLRSKEQSSTRGPAISSPAHR
ncbi:hypothetical protein ON010_g7005 [Phytophthora cinnamomi]|nr:hypothetical protein ON010_g7005 [Phytophthora cinnamomi]